MTSWQAVLRTDHQEPHPAEASAARRIQGLLGKTSVRAFPQAKLVEDALRMARTAYDWLQSKRVQQLASRRLRVAETISLGDKRFVSILQVDGAQFLIGGSASSVQLLAVLDQPSPAASGPRNEVAQ